MRKHFKQSCQKETSARRVTFSKLHTRKITYDNFLNLSSTTMSSPEDLLRKLCFSEDGLLDVPLKMEKIIKSFQTKQNTKERFDRGTKRVSCFHLAKLKLACTAF